MTEELKLKAEEILKKYYEKTFASPKYDKRVNKKMDEEWILPAMLDFHNSLSKKEDLNKDIKELLKKQRELCAIAFQHHAPNELLMTTMGMRIFSEIDNAPEPETNDLKEDLEASGNAADQQIEVVDTEFVYVPISVEKELPPSEKTITGIFNHGEDNWFCSLIIFRDGVVYTYDRLIEDWTPVKNCKHWLKKLPITSIKVPVIDWEGLEKSFYEDCTYIDEDGLKETRHYKTVINWIKTNILKYIK